MIFLRFWQAQRTPSNQAAELPLLTLQQVTPESPGQNSLLVLLPVTDPPAPAVTRSGREIITASQALHEKRSVPIAALQKSAVLTVRAAPAATGPDRDALFSTLHAQAGQWPLLWAQIGGG